MFYSLHIIFLIILSMFGTVYPRRIINHYNSLMVLYLFFIHMYLSRPLISEHFWGLCWDCKFAAKCDISSNGMKSIHSSKRFYFEVMIEVTSQQGAVLAFLSVFTVGFICALCLRCRKKSSEWQTTHMLFSCSFRDIRVRKYKNTVFCFFCSDCTGE